MLGLDRIVSWPYITSMSSTQITVDTNVLSYMAGETDILATLTTDHPASSYGLPVVILDGVAVGPAECPAIVWAESDELIEAARRAGYAIDPAARYGDPRVY